MQEIRLFPAFSLFAIDISGKMCYYINCKENIGKAMTLKFMPHLCGRVFAPFLLL